MASKRILKELKDPQKAISSYPADLAARGLKSGGTVQQRAERLFLLKVFVRTKKNAEKKLTLTYEEMEAEREEQNSFWPRKISSFPVVPLVEVDHMVVELIRVGPAVEELVGVDVAVEGHGVTRAPRLGLWSTQGGDSNGEALAQGERGSRRGTERMFGRRFHLPAQLPTIAVQGRAGG